MKKENKYIDMQYLNEVSSNKDFQRKIFKLFREEIVTIETHMKTALEIGDYSELADLAHKAKSSVSILGMKKEAETMKQLQVDILENKNEGSYKSTVYEFIQACRTALDEIDAIEKEF
jgi:HPt (histidine-containing phosphotransfer) domain-containing protein